MLCIINEIRVYSIVVEVTFNLANVPNSVLLLNY